MSKLPKERRDKILLIGMATVGLAVGLWFVLIGPLRNSLAKHEKELAELRAQV